MSESGGLREIERQDTGDLEACVYEINGEVAVWLEPQGGVHMGVCVGVGTSRAEAVASAVANLEAVVEVLQGPPPDLSR